MLKKIMILVVAMSLGLSISAYADFSYNLSFPSHDNVVVTALGSGKLFLRLDGVLYQSKIGKLQVEDSKKNLFAVYDKGQILRVDLSEGTFFKVRVLDPSAQKSQYTYKKVSVDKVAVGDLYSPDAYLFSYRVRTKYRMYELSQMSMAKEVPVEFKTAIATFGERRIAR